MDHHDQEALTSREREDHWFGHPAHDNDDDRPVHQPEAPDAPIPGRHWYAGCDPDRPRVTDEGRCESCGAQACPTCGRENCPDHGQVAA